MGCFLACFGSSKNSNRKHRHKVQPNNHKPQLPSHGSLNSLQTSVTLVHGDCPVQSSVCSIQESSEKPISPVTETRDKPVEQPISPVRKKVTFDSNVKTYEHILLDESTDFSPETEDGCNKEIDLSKASNSQSSEDKSLTISSSGSCPTNHRYQNCRDSDNELEYEGSDIEDVDNEDDDDDDVKLDYADVDNDYDDIILESRTRNIQSVLNPVENLTQWNAAKAKGTTQQLKQQKENFNSEQDPSRRISFTSSARINKLSSFSFESDFEPKKSTSQEISVDASLSNWLSSTESTPSTNTSKFGFNTPTPERSISYGSISPRSFEDRPILGVLTVEELKQISSSSLRKSPNRNPDEMPIIGTVGTYWNHAAAKDCNSVNSFKGIPNTTNKYREDKRVNWHSTPFETQLERAMSSS